MLNTLVRTPARLALPMVLLCAAPVAQAQEAPASPQQREHVVRRGDTLWDLARAYLSNPFEWPRIYEANRNVVENPHWIYPAERLIIPPLLQRDPLGRQGGEPLGTPVAIEMRDVSQQPPQVLEEAVAETPTVVASVDLRRPVVPIAEFLAAPWLNTRPEAELTGRVMRLADPSAREDRLPSMLHPNDRVLVGDLRGRRAEPGDSLQIVRFERQVNGHGRIVVPLAVLLVEAVSPTVVTARVVRQFGDARLADLVMPLDFVPAIATGPAEVVADGPRGQLIDFLDQDPIRGTTDHAFISLGSAQGVGIGDEFVVYEPARRMDERSSEQLPPETVGTVRVVRVMDRTATVRVLSVNSSALREGLPVQLVRKMP